MVDILTGGEPGHHPDRSQIGQDGVLDLRGTAIRGAVQHFTMFDYDFAVGGDPSSSTPISSLAIPKGALILGGWYEVLTTFTTASSDSGTVALSLVGADDLVAAIAVDDGSAPWDVDLTKRRPLLSIAAPIAADQFVKAISGVAAVTAGVLMGVVEWVHPDQISSGH